MTTNCILWEDLHCGLFFLPFWETFQVDYWRDSWSEPNKDLYLNKYYAWAVRLCGALYHIIQSRFFFSSFLFSSTYYFPKFLSILDLLTFGWVLLSWYAGCWRHFFCLTFVHHIDPFWQVLTSKLEYILYDLKFPYLHCFIIFFLVHLALGLTPLNCDTNIPCW